MKVIDAAQVWSVCYDVPWSDGLPGLGIGMIRASFHIVGIAMVRITRLKMAVRYSIARLPSFFSMTIAMPSEPRALDGLALAIACAIFSVEKLGGL